MSLSINDINRIAFITPAIENQVSEHFITAVETGELFDILGETLHTGYTQYPSYINQALNNLIYPFVSYKVKYLSFIKVASELTEENENLQSAIQESKSLALSFKTNLQNLLYTTFGIIPQSITGFLIPQTIIDKNAIDMELVITPVIADDNAPFIFTVEEAEVLTYNLPHELKNKSLVFVNNAIINPANYTGIGKEIITFTTALEIYDKLVITF